MHSTEDFISVASEVGLSEISRLLAVGVLRLHRRRLLEPANSMQKELSESVRQGLEVSRETVLSVTSG